MNNQKFVKKEKEITDWLNNTKIKNYILIPDEKYGFLVDVDGDVNLEYKKLKLIPIKFNKINGDFLCIGNDLTSLEFCPKEISGVFNIQQNKINNLYFFPNSVKNDCYLGGNDDLGKLQFERSFSVLYDLHITQIKEYENKKILCAMENKIASSNININKNKI